MNAVRLYYTGIYIYDVPREPIDSVSIPYIKQMIKPITAISEQCFTYVSTVYRRDVLLRATVDFIGID